MRRWIWGGLGELGRCWERGLLRLGDGVVKEVEEEVVVRVEEQGEVAIRA
jgi:hypothetical protein